MDASCLPLLLFKPFELVGKVASNWGELLTWHSDDVAIKVACLLRSLNEVATCRITYANTINDAT